MVGELLRLFTDDETFVMLLLEEMLAPDFTPDKNTKKKNKTGLFTSCSYMHTFTAVG